MSRKARDAVYELAPVTEDPAGLRPLERLVLLVLAEPADDAGEAWPSLKTIARKACMSRRSLLRHLAALERKGLVSRRPRYRPKGGRTSSLYTLHVVGDGATNDTPILPAGGTPQVPKTAPPQGQERHGPGATSGTPMNRQSNLQYEPPSQTVAAEIAGADALEATTAEAIKDLAAQCVKELGFGRGQATTLAHYLKYIGELCIREGSIDIVQTIKDWIREAKRGKPRSPQAVFGSYMRDRLGFQAGQYSEAATAAVL